MIAEGWLARLQRRRPARSPKGTVRRHAVGRPRLGRLTLTRARRRLILIVAVVAIALGGLWLWLRDSPLVAVERVAITGVSGPDAAAIRSALVAAARNMTTLDVRMGQLRTAVRPYPVVKDVQVSTQFPHGMRIHVIEQIAVGAIVVNGRTTPVAGDGTLLHDVAAPPSLPAIPLRVAPGGSRLSDAGALRAVAVLAAAPYQLLARVAQITTVASHGLVAQLRNGPSIYFGDSTRLRAKWVAATAVLADAGSVGAVYVDVTDPGRPAAGSADGGSSTTTTAGTAPTGGRTGPGGAAGGTAPTASTAGASTSPSTPGGG